MTKLWVAKQALEGAKAGEEHVKSLGCLKTRVGFCTWQGVIA